MEDFGIIFFIVFFMLAFTAEVWLGAIITYIFGGFKWSRVKDFFENYNW